MLEHRVQVLDERVVDVLADEGGELDEVVAPR